MIIRILFIIRIFCGSCYRNRRRCLFYCSRLALIATDVTFIVFAKFMPHIRSINDGTAVLDGTFLPMRVGIVFPLGLLVTCRRNDKAVFVGALLGRLTVARDDIAGRSFCFIHAVCRTAGILQLGDYT